MKKKPIDLIDDICELHSNFGVYKALVQLDKAKGLEFLKFRFACIQEEVTEGVEAIENKDPEEVVDALIDIMVFTLGTLDAFNVDIIGAWREVHKANMAKKLGIKEGRPNPFGLPDLMKPEGWVAPSHEGNHGCLPTILA